jgi:acetyl-CoA acetyltransferase
MGAIFMKEVLNRAGVKPEQVDEVMFGSILTAGQGQNVARQANVKVRFRWKRTLIILVRFYVIGDPPAACTSS